MRRFLLPCLMLATVAHADESLTPDAVDQYIEQQKAQAQAKAPLYDYEQTRSFKEELQKQFPMTAEQVRQYRLKAQKIERAKNQSLYSIKTRYPLVQYIPNKTIQMHTVPGRVSSIIFFDSLGHMIPIVSWHLGDKLKNFEITQHKTNANVLMLDTNNDYSQTNLIVVLKDLDEPINIEIDSSQSLFDAKLSVRVTTAQSLTALGAGKVDDLVSNDLLLLMNGIKPEQAKKIALSLPNSQAYRYHDKLYIRTRYLMLSAYRKKINSASGYVLYELNQTNTIVVANAGKTQTVVVGDE